MSAVGPHGVMPLYDLPSLRGMHSRFHGVPPRGSPNLMGRYQIRSEASDDVESEPPSDSVRSIPSAADDLYDLHSNVSDEYPDYLNNDALLRQVRERSSGSDFLGFAEPWRAGVTGSSGSSIGSRSVVRTPPSALAVRLRDLARGQSESAQGDSELSDPPDLFGVETDESRDSASDDELSNMNSAEEDYDDRADEVPLPPQLPEASEERLQEAWPLGANTFGIFLCPITHDVMTDPVVSADGYTYERSAISRWFDMSRKSPVTGQTLPHTELVPNQSVRTLLKTLIDMTASSTNTNGAKSDGNSAQEAFNVTHSTQVAPRSGGVCTGNGEEEACGSSGETTLPLWTPPQELPSRSSGTESRCGEQWTEQQPQARASPSSACSSPSAAACSSQSASTTSNGAGHGSQRRTSQSHQQSSPIPTGSQAQGASGSGGNQVPAPRSPSSACSQPQQLPQAPSTALPPLRAGQSPPMQDPSAPRGRSAHFGALSLSAIRSSAAGNTAPRQPAPPPVPPPPDRASGNSCGSRAVSLNMPQQQQQQQQQQRRRHQPQPPAYPPPTELEGTIAASGGNSPGGANRATVGAHWQQQQQPQQSHQPLREALSSPAMSPPSVVLDRVFF